MGCIQQAILCSQLIIVRAEFSGQTLVPHLNACWLLVCFVSYVIVF